ncbi:MAG: hypothetical protein GY778_03325 [bacterium]|nr:hypothetical protein [bacterium]
MVFQVLPYLQRDHAQSTMLLELQSMVAFARDQHAVSRIAEAQNAVATVDPP